MELKSVGDLINGQKIVTVNKPYQQDTHFTTLNLPGSYVLEDGSKIEIPYPIKSGGINGEVVNGEAINEEVVNGEVINGEVVNNLQSVAGIAYRILLPCM